MISRREMSFKLTPGTIQALTKFYDDVFSHQITATIYTCPRKVKVARAKVLRQDFVKAVNDFVFLTHVSALVSLGKNGSGSLGGNPASISREAIHRLFVSIVPPPREVNLPLAQGMSWSPDRGSQPIFGSLEFFEALPNTRLSDGGQDSMIGFGGDSTSGVVEYPRQSFIGNEHRSPPLYDSISSHHLGVLYSSDIAEDMWYLNGSDHSDGCFLPDWVVYN